MGQHNFAAADLEPSKCEPKTGEKSQISIDEIVLIQTDAEQRYDVGKED